MAPMKLQGLVNYVLGNYVLFSNRRESAVPTNAGSGLGLGEAPWPNQAPADSAFAPSPVPAFYQPTDASAAAVAAGLAIARPKTPPPKGASVTPKKQTPLSQRLNEFRALPYFVKAAKAGDARAKAVLAFYWEHGLAGLNVSYTRSEPLYVQAALAGVPLAQARLAFLKMYGRPGVPINQTEARTWRKRLSRRGRRSLHWLKLAADAGLPSAQFCLASCFYNAIGTRKDDRRAFVFAGKAATQGHSAAQNLLGMLYVDGVPPDVAPDPTTGLRWYIRASEQGEASAIYNIATLIERGAAGDLTSTQAFRWYLRAAEYGSVSAANIVGLFYEQGVIAGEGMDHGKAAEWYARAAAQGHPFAQYNIGRCLIEGIGVPIDYTKALGYFERAAHQRHVLSRISLACMWESGLGVDRPDKRRSLEWFRRAAYRGSREAQRRLKPVWATRVLVACRALLAGPTIPAPGVDVDETGLWSLPVELKEQIVRWLNSEIILSKQEMRGVIRYGCDRSTLVGSEFITSRPLQLSALSISAPVEYDSPDALAEIYMKKLQAQECASMLDAEAEPRQGTSSAPDSPGSLYRGMYLRFHPLSHESKLCRLLADSMNRPVPGFGTGMSARRSGANTPLRSWESEDEIERPVAPVFSRPAPTFASFLAQLGIRNYAARRTCNCPEGSCVTLRHVMAKYYDRVQIDSDVEEEEEPEGVFETPENEMFLVGPDEPMGVQAADGENGEEVVEAANGFENEFEDQEEDVDFLYDEVAGIVTGEDLDDVDDARSVDGSD